MNKRNLTYTVLGVAFVLTCVLLYDRDQVIDSEESKPSIPVTRTETKEHDTDSVEILPQQDLKESTPETPLPSGYAAEDGSQNILPTISYSLVPLEYDQKLAMLPGTTSLFFPLSIDPSALIDEPVSERDCRSHDSIVFKPCIPSLAVESKRATFNSIETENISSIFQVDCGSLQENTNRHNESGDLKEQCLGGINISGENWNLELWSAMTYRINTNQESFEIIPCPEGELTECTTLGAGLKIGIP